MFFIIIGVFIVGISCSKTKEKLVLQEEVEIPNPWIDCDNLKAAMEIAKYEVEFPDKIEGYPNILMQAIPNTSIQIFYSDKEFEKEDNKSILIRKGRGQGDISGDYQKYSEKDILELDGKKILVNGKNSLIYKAIWREGDFSYSIGVEKGISKEELKRLAKLVK